MSTSLPARFRGIALEPLLTEVEVMNLLKVSRPKLRELVRDNRLRAVEFMRHRRYLKQDIVDFLEGSAPKHEVKRKLMMTPRDGLKQAESVAAKGVRR